MEKFSREAREEKKKKHEISPSTITVPLKYYKSRGLTDGKFSLEE